ncbi:hypothetical protein SDC9_06283 [bioreactor metagenome]|uniref:Uncharacterized protein n=1 Tax=bioreactor metagenome TaxID=1076179 RepID=A0A644T3M2_9ZZZZ
MRHQCSCHQSVEFGIIGKGAVDLPPGAQHDAVGLRAGEELGPAAGAADHQIGGRTRGQRGRIEAAGAGGVRGEGARPVGAGVVEMRDPRRLAHHLDHVEIAIGIERIAGVVGGEADVDAARSHLVHQRHPAPARRAAGRAVLQVHVAHRQADDIQPGLRDQIERARRLGLGLHGKRTAMPHRHRRVEAHFQRHLGDHLQRRDRGVAGLVDVEIGLQPAPRRMVEEHPQPPAQVGDRIGDGAKHAARAFDDRRGAAEGAALLDHVDRHEARALQRDPPGPVLAQLGEDGEGDRILRRETVEMGADPARAMRPGTAQRELHPRAHILGRPVRHPVGADGGQRALERAVGVRRARPDMALVEMRVHVDEGRKDHLAGHVHHGRVGRHRRDDPAIRDGQVDLGQVALLSEEAGRGFQIDQTIRAAGQNAKIHQFSRLMALSCHL